MFLTPAAGLSVWFALFLHLTVFAAAAMACHGRLAVERPAPSLLTEFYFWVAFGGLLGGLFNTLIAPVIFDSVIEYPLMILCACVVASPSAKWWRDVRVSRRGLSARDVRSHRVDPPRDRPVRGGSISDRSKPWRSRL